MLELQIERTGCRNASKSLVVDTWATQAEAQIIRREFRSLRISQVGL